MLLLKKKIKRVLIIGEKIHKRYAQQKKIMCFYLCFIAHLMKFGSIAENENDVDLYRFFIFLFFLGKESCGKLQYMY